MKIGTLNKLKYLQISFLFICKWYNYIIIILHILFIARQYTVYSIYFYTNYIMFNDILPIIIKLHIRFVR